MVGATICHGHELSSYIDNVLTTHTLQDMATINVRIDDKIKKAASKALAEIGLDLSSAIKIFLYQVIIEKGLPFTPTKNLAVIRARQNREANHMP